MAMTEKQQERVQVCENNRMRRIAGMKRIDRTRTEDPREEAGVKESFNKKLAASQLKSAGHANGRTTVSIKRSCSESGR